MSYSIIYLHCVQINVCSYGQLGNTFKHNVEIPIYLTKNAYLYKKNGMGVNECIHSKTLPLWRWKSQIMSQMHQVGIVHFSCEPKVAMQDAGCGTEATSNREHANAPQ